MLNRALDVRILSRILIFQQAESYWHAISENKTKAYFIRNFQNKTETKIERLLRENEKSSIFLGSDLRQDVSKFHYLFSFKFKYTGLKRKMFIFISLSSMTFQVMSVFEELHNFTGLVAFLSALNSSCVHRLSWCWSVRKFALCDEFSQSFINFNFRDSTTKSWNRTIDLWLFASQGGRKCRKGCRFGFKRNFG